MPLPDPDLIPPELALDTPPVTDAEVAELVAMAAELALDPEQLPDLTDTVDGSPARWRIEDDGAAEWAARKYAAAMAELEPIDQARARWVARIDTWYEQTAGPVLGTAAFFEGHLRDYVRRIRAASAGDIKSVRLPSARLWSRGSDTPKVVVTDKERAATWAEAHVEEACKVETSVLLTPLRERVVAWAHDIELPCPDDPDGQHTVGCGCERDLVLAVIDLVLVQAGCTWDPKTERVVNAEGEPQPLVLLEPDATGLSWDLPAIAYGVELTDG